MEIEVAIPLVQSSLVNDAVNTWSRATKPPQSGVNFGSSAFPSIPKVFFDILLQIVFWNILQHMNVGISWGLSIEGFVAFVFGIIVSQAAAHSAVWLAWWSWRNVRPQKRDE